MRYGDLRISPFSEIYSGVAGYAVEEFSPPYRFHGPREDIWERTDRIDPLTGAVAGLYETAEQADRCRRRLLEDCKFRPHMRWL